MMRKILFTKKKVKVVQNEFKINDLIATGEVVNEAVILEKKTIFIAVPKTGTTSVRSQLKQEGRALVGNSHLNIIQIRDLIYIHVLKSALGKNSAFPNNNMPDDLSLRKRANDIFNDCFKFSAVRNPWARAVSIYFRREGVQLHEKMSFEEFCEKHTFASDTCQHPTLHKNQYDWFCNENGENIMDFIYKMEDMDQAFKEISEQTSGRVSLVNVKKNVNPISKSKKYQDLYTDHTRKLIAKNFEKDIDVFKYTF